MRMRGGAVRILLLPNCWHFAQRWALALCQTRRCPEQDLLAGQAFSGIRAMEQELRWRQANREKRNVEDHGSRRGFTVAAATRRQTRGRVGGGSGRGMAHGACFR